MLGLIKVVVVVAVIAVVGGLATHWVKNKATAALHHTIDTALPGEVEAHAWAPVSHGKPVGTARVRFAHGTVTSLGCHTASGDLLREHRPRLLVPQGGRPRSRPAAPAGGSARHSRTRTASTTRSEATPSS